MRGVFVSLLSKIFGSREAHPPVNQDDDHSKEEKTQLDRQADDADRRLYQLELQLNARNRDRNR